MTSFMISTSVGIMLERHGTKLDIIYDEPPQPGRTYAYNKVIMWDDYAAVADEWPTFSPWPGLTPEPMPTPTSTPTETPINTAIPASDPTPNPADTQPPEASPTQTHDQKTPIFQQEYLWVATAGTIVACIGIVAIVISRKRNSNRKG